jgi:enoyl-CoA hydratase/carnithine racemase
MHFTLTQAGGIARIELSRPERRNALSLDMMRSLEAALRSLPAETPVVVLGAQGPVFCSGHDLREMTGRTLAAYREIFDACCSLMSTLQSIPQPVIAEVQGMATAAGCQLVAACDLAVAADTAEFATPGVRIGLFCTTPMVELTRSIGRKRAMQMLLTGRPINAVTAAEWGLINAAVPAKMLRSTVEDIAAEIVRASPLTVGTGKRAFYSQVDLDKPAAYAYAKEAMSMNALTADAHEGITAFLERRPACWTGR